MKKEKEKVAVDLDARKQRLDKQAETMRKARARLRKNQRHQQAQRLRELGEAIEDAAGRKVSMEEVRELGRLLAGHSTTAAYETPLPSL